MADREHFGRFGALMAMAGSAVGLGNMWRFPYLLGENGGAVFIIVYVLCALLIALPMFFAEFIVGRRASTNCYGAFRNLSGNRKSWKYAGFLCIVTSLIILSFYSVIGGWSLEYLFKACTFSFTSGVSEDALSSVFSDFVSSVWPPLLGFLIFLGLSAMIVLRGIKKGIERFGKVVMPVLFFIVVAIAVYVIFLPGSEDGYVYLFRPDWSKLSPRMVLAALGQAFFSMSLGCGCILTYASYVRKKDNLLFQCTATTMMDFLFAMIAGCAIMPAVFAFGVNPGSGPSLVYETLPFIFSKMPGGGFVAIVFFFALIVAALTSTISLYETAIAMLVEEKGLGRRKAVIIIFLGTAILGALCSLSFGPLSDVRISGNTIFDFCDHLTANYLMIFCSFITVIFVGWVMKKEDVRDEFTSGGKHSSGLFNAAYFMIRYFAPLGILAIFITQIVA